MEVRMESVDMSDLAEYRWCLQWDTGAPYAFFKNEEAATLALNHAQQAGRLGKLSVQPFTSAKRDAISRALATETFTTRALS